jgi:hypothetical protein
VGSQLQPLAARGQTPFESIEKSLNDFKPIQINPDLFRSKQTLHELQKLEIKYGCEGLEERNNFLHKNFSNF